MPVSPLELAKKLSFEIVNGGGCMERQIDGVYCGDLLSMVMGRAQADNVWITVMGNVNTIAVAVLADISCIILSENTTLDIDAIAKAQAQEICVLASGMPTFETAMAVQKALSEK